MRLRLLFSIIGLSFFISSPVVTSGQCTASFNTIVTPGFTAVQFYDASTGANLWNWDFGDGTSSTQQNPVHNYATTGSYNVCLVIIGLTGCVDSLCQQVVVPAQGACTASFTVQPVAPGFPGFLFTGSGTGVSPFLFSWNFGDGTVLPASPLNTTNYIYQSPGTYNVCLTVTDANNCTATTCQTVTYGASSCTPTFIANDLLGTVLFQDATFSLDPVVAWTWNFGDGSSASGSGNTTHTYQQSGSYNVCLSIITQSGCTGSACSTIVVTVPAACSASFTFAPSAVPFGMNFTPNIIPGTATQVWDFGDGSLPVISSTPSVQQHVYASSGSYSVCLTVQDGLCSDTFCTNVVVAPVSAIDDPAFDRALTVFPNPANESCILQLDAEPGTDCQVDLLDAAGRSLSVTFVRTTRAGNVWLQLNLQDVPSGIYRLSVDNRNNRSIGKLVVLK